MYVKVTDSGGLESAEVPIVVTITDVQEAPVITPNQVFTFNENQADQTLAATVIASDEDNGSSMSLTITSGALGSDSSTTDFEIVGSNLRIRSKAGNIINHENKQAYLMGITVTDNDGLATPGTITIMIGDVNDPPVINDVTLSIAEHRTGQNPCNVARFCTPGAVVGDLVATDEDGDSLTFTLSSGNTDSTFALSSAGKLTVAALSSGLQSPATGAFTLGVRVEDGNGGSDTATVTIDVTNVNYAPNFSAQSMNVCCGVGGGAGLGMREWGRGRRKEGENERDFAQKYSHRTLSSHPPSLRRQSTKTCNKLFLEFSFVTMTMPETHRRRSASTS